MDNQLMEVLQALPVADLNYSEWISVGMALKEEGYPLDVWDSWSRNDSRYRLGDCERHWNSFSGNTTPVRAGTIVQMAKERGVWPPVYYGTAGVLAWDAVIDVDEEPAPVQQREPWEDLVLYLETLFQPDEYVSYVVQSYQDRDEKWKPSSSGVYNRTAGELIADLKHYHGDMSYTIGDWNPEAGAWIRFNPVDGTGVKNDNITSYRYALVESDTLSIGDQIDRYRRLQLPVAALVNSGGKSVHAIVRIEAEDKDEYRKRVAYLYDFLGKHGVPIDQQNKNPSRLSRLPGVTRGGRIQQLLGVNMGRRSWADWMEFAEAENDNLPPIINLSDVYDNPPPLAEELIVGVLRRGHKMLISSDSKAGKSFLLMNLAVAIATGQPWMGFEVRKGRVLYVNFEISEPSALNRIIQICHTLGVQREDTGNIEIWNMRGRACTLEEFVPKLLRRIQGQKLDAIIIDPIYKVIMGDENNASDMGTFCNQFDRICEAANCSCIYAHHHTKGAQGGKKAMDRASGSGVFARDPDAQLDVSQLAVSDNQRADLRPDGYEYATPWRMEGTLREFAPFEPVDFWFTYPTYTIDPALKKFGIEGSMEAATMYASEARANKAEDQYVTAWYDIADDKEPGDKWVTAREMAVEMGVSKRAVNDYFTSHPDLFTFKEVGRTRYYQLNGYLE